ncbi:MAG TPA: MlaD family protein [Solirubrobacterales bacterium]|nr:MlaD family protein [Solirubrobacterales bacterium]
MRRAIIALALVAAVVVVVLLVSGGGGGNGYVVRAVFDNGAFMVKGEQVRVAGANVGTIKSVSVSQPGEPVAYRDGKMVAVPGKAILTMEITDPGFQDFRKDGGCEIRPQSLIGEKFVDCNPTLPRAPGAPAPPPLQRIPDGKPGEGQYLLPLGSNTTSVDPDLINDIQSLPYAQRFRLIFNELGAGLAGRGKDIETIVKRANPVLRDTDTLFGILSAQRDQLAKLASDSEEILGPLSEKRAQFAGFLNNAGAAALASSERGTELEESFEKFPEFLRQFRLTMRSLQGFSDAAAPVFEELGRAAPSLTDATRTLTPFSQATTVALKSLGSAGEAAGPILAETEPVIGKSAELAKSGVSPTAELAALFGSLEKTRGWDALNELIYNTSAVVNGFDQYGHYARTLATLTNCNDYEVSAAGLTGCVANFNGPNANELAAGSMAGISRLLYGKIETELAKRSGGTPALEGPAIGIGQNDSTGKPNGGAALSNAGAVGPLLSYAWGAK